MAGHSQFKNIMHRKGAQDAKRAKIFTKILREVTVAAKEGGTDPATNPRLRNALQQARTVNMPKENAQRAIDKASESAETYETLQYEAMGPGQVAFLIDVLTDNRNRTASEIPVTIRKNGGFSANVKFMFEHLGMIVYEDVANLSSLVEDAIEAGAQDIHEEEKSCTIFCAVSDFGQVRDALEEKYGVCTSGNLIWMAPSPATLEDPEEITKVRKLVDALENMDDVQHVWINALLPEDQEG